MDPITAMLLVTVSLLIVCVIALWFLRGHVREQTAQLQSIHILVNSRLSKALDDISALRKQLLDADENPGR